MVRGLADGDGLGIRQFLAGEYRHGRNENVILPRKRETALAKELAAIGADEVARGAAKLDATEAVTGIRRLGSGFARVLEYLHEARGLAGHFLRRWQRTDGIGFFVAPLLGHDAFLP